MSNKKQIHYHLRDITLELPPRRLPDFLLKKYQLSYDPNTNPPYKKIPRIALPIAD